MANAVFYSNVAQQTTLTGSISSGATTISVGATTGFPPSFPYTLALDYGAATEELVSVTAAAGTSLTVTRGYGSTSAQSHSLGAVVRHVYDATDATAFRTHEAATAAVHGVAGTLVGTSDTQTLANKTLTNPTLNSAALSGTFTGSPTFSGTPTFSGSPIVNGTLQMLTDTSFMESTKSATGLKVAGSLVTGDLFDRYRLLSEGKQEWGPGNVTRDTNLYRSGVGILATDGSLNVGGALAVTGDITASTTTWTPFTPTWTVGGSPATSTNVGWYKKLGKLVWFEVYTVWSASGTGTAQVSFTLPSTPFRDGAGANTTRQLASNGWAVNLNIASNGAVMGQVLAGGTGSTAVVAFYDTTAFQGQYITNTTIMTLQGWYREA